MAKIVWVMTGLNRKTFSGGSYCILKHAGGLAARGHEVVVTTLQPAHFPGWASEFPGRFALPSRSRLAAKAWRNRRGSTAYQKLVKGVVGAFTASFPGALPLGVRHGVYVGNSKDLEDADVTVATSFETALPTHLHGKGKKFYFCQHFEPYFSGESDDPALAESLAIYSYQLPLDLIANSEWLKGKLSGLGRDSHIAYNAVDSVMFSERPERNAGCLRLISYGGRGAKWKGFADMVEGVAMARRVLGEIEWRVYGPADIPPTNPTAPYTSLGFLQQAELAKAYAEADVMISASWYESFPLFPLEAMAAGAVAVTTLPGAEAYARHLETAYVIPPRNPEAICNAIVTLARDRELMRRLAKAGREEAAKFNWTASQDRMEQLLLGAD